MILYHATFASRAAAIRKSGLIPATRRGQQVWHNRFGANLGTLGACYAFREWADAVRWAGKMEYDFKRPVVLVEFEDDATAWAPDALGALLPETSMERAGSVPAAQIRTITRVTTAMLRDACAQWTASIRARSVPAG